MDSQVLPFDEALAVVLEQARQAPAPMVDSVALDEATGRVLAERILADRDQPPFDRSTRDGYAVCSAGGGERVLVGSIRAGESWAGPALAANEALEIMTGAPIPAGADAVVMVEHTTVRGAIVHTDRTLRAGENIVARGAEARANAGVLRSGTLIAAAEIAVAASCGCATLPVFARPTVAIVATGDELVEVSAIPSAAQIRNSNSYALAAMVRAEGGTPLRLAIARDTRDDIHARIVEVLSADLVILSGGVSMGKFDLVEEVLAALGAEFFFTGALIQPGKPIVFGRLPSRRGWTWFFGLPGNPVSTQVTFSLFVAPVLRALSGRVDLAPRFVEARLAEDVKGGMKVTRFLPADLVGSVDAVTVAPVAWQGSGDIAANARGNAYVVLPADVEGFAAGDSVRVLLR